jgi:uncharacterized membrane protein YedE/YeeE
MLWLVFAAFFGFILGFLAQKSRFCMVAAFRDIFLLGDARKLKGIITMLILLTFIYTLFLSLRLPRFDEYIYASPYSLIGGFIFAFGAVLAGGCFMSSFYRVGEGYVQSLLALIFAGIGLMIGAAAIWPYLPIPLGKAYAFLGGIDGKITLAQILGTIPILIGGVQIAILALIFYFLSKRYE